MQEWMEERFSRQTRFAPIGVNGQLNLWESQAVIIGAGALGTVAANHLVRGGVGTVTIVDRDFVEPSNLQRQLLFDERDAEEMKPKAAAAEEKLKAINSRAEIRGIISDVNAGNVEDFILGADVVIDGTDNFQTRFLVNDACFKHSIPFLYGGAVSSRGMMAPFVPGETLCFRCLLGGGQDTSGETCDTVGVLAPLVDMTASLQAVEAMKLLSGAGQALRRSLVQYDIWSFSFREFPFPQPRPDCPTCATLEYPDLNRSLQSETAALCGRDSVQVQAAEAFDLETWAEKLERAAEVKKTPFLLRADIETGERLVVFPDGRVIVQGTEDPARAKSLVSRYIGV
ncbi:adenylyltransferase/sulfurtransferase [Salsuginibacillus halophilus]|uniref:Adenylyltransferase/sulfurtransferase n=1 Tax=Salsuginibacillus halophilus TaxID=517424 RepID=A0A2P8H802_9BACI|nr:ThiF family adenylyltransferase [Salsuginibacillus halophilus]PSL42319.1 adenylyltransferase/sulfurtransferase [Salsuginibacillus halophilus]